MSQENVKKKLIIESQYWGTIEYWSLLLHYGDVVIERMEHYVKSSYRNRTTIATPDGILNMSVPIAHGRQQRSIMNSVCIHQEYNWMAKHWQSLCSAYRRSPYFEYYEDDLEPIYKQKWDTLLEFNHTIAEFINDQLQLGLNLSFTDTFQKKYDTLDDFRSALLPTASRHKGFSLYKAPVYHQVFQDKTEFYPNLSMADLLFNEGPRAVDYLRKSIL